MSTFKRSQVVMLPTKEKAQIVQRHYNLQMTPVPKSIKEVSYPDSSYLHHLYFLSDDEIKEGDWYIDSLVSHWNNVGPLQMAGYANKECTVIQSTVGTTSPVTTSKKIIATTDKSLKSKGKMTGYNVGDDDEESISFAIKYLPEPSQGFIKKYCEKGGIDEVMVEYDRKSNTQIEKELGIYGHDEGLTESEYKEYCKSNEVFTLKVASDNTITIKPIKDSWNREEVIEVCRNAYEAGYKTCAVHVGYEDKEISIEDWIKENL